MGFLQQENGDRLLLEDGGRVWLEDAPWIYLRTTLSTALAHDTSPQDMLRQVGPDAVGFTFALTASGSNVPINLDGTTGWAWYSERVTTLVTLTGLSFRHYAWVSAGAATAGTIRVRVWAISAGPEHEERLLADVTGGTLPTTYTVLQTWSVPLVSSPAVLSPGERLVVRVTAEPIPATTMEDGEITFYLGGTAGGIPPADVALLTDPDLPLRDNFSRLYLRRTATTGVGSFFDALETAVDQVPATAVVNTSDGVDAPWTQTPGGAVIAWVSPRFSGSWYFQNASIVVSGSPVTISRAQGILYAIESNAAANAALAVLVARWRGATETTCAVIALSRGGVTELPLTYPPGTDLNVNSGLTGTVITPLDFQPDDRLVVRLLLKEDSVLVGGYTATVSYDGTPTQSYLELFDTDLGFKAEADPATPPSVPGADMMGGVGN